MPLLKLKILQKPECSATFFKDINLMASHINFEKNSDNSKTESSIQEEIPT